MVSDVNDIKGDYSKVWVFIGLIFVFEFIASLALTAGGGFSEPSFTQRFIIYALFAFFGLGAIFFVVNYNKNRGKKVFLVPLHEPEDSLLGSLKFFRNPYLLILLMIIFFAPVFFIAAKYANTFFSGIPFHTQQISTFSNIFGDAGFPTISENLLMYIPLVLLLTANWLLLRRVKVLFWLNNIVTIPLIMAYIWLNFHNLVYSGNEFAQGYTLVFGYVGILLTLLTMSFIPWAIIHFLSNFMLSAKKIGLLGNDNFLYELIGVWIVLIIIFIITNYYVKDKKSGSG